MTVEARRFFVIGGQRCGTTLLHVRLDQHPDVAMHAPLRPEPKHFLQDGSEDISIEEYDRRYFAGQAAAVRGEKGTTYLERPDAASRILQRFPDPRFVAVVRDPVDRAISNYRFSCDSRRETLPPEQALTIEAEQRAWDRETVSASPFAYLRRGKYAEQLDAWASVVGRQRIHVLSFGEVVAGDLRELQSFLGIEPLALEVPRHPANQAREQVDEEQLLDLRRSLAAYFHESNSLLQRDWLIDTTKWATP